MCLILGSGPHELMGFAEVEPGQSAPGANTVPPGLSDTPKCSAIALTPPAPFTSANTLKPASGGGYFAYPLLPYSALPWTSASDFFQGRS